MNKKRFTRLSATIAVLVFMFAYPAPGQLPEKVNATMPENTITASELRDHIFFLASDFMAGRVATSPEYNIAANYVASQFAEAGIEPLVTLKDGSKSYFQKVPFSKTEYSDKPEWELTKDGKTGKLEFNKDFKILYGNKINFENLDIVYVGYGIEEPEYDWNDFKGLDVTGKILVCISGVPSKDGKNILPEEISSKYSGVRGLQTKIGPLFSKAPAGIILVDIDSSSGMPFDAIPSQFETKKFIYKGKAESSSESIPSIYLARPSVIEMAMNNEKNNPLTAKGGILARYKTGDIKGASLTGKIKVISEEPFYSTNVVGVVRGTDPVLKNEYIVVGAHLDHVKPVNGQVCNGADDNASGSSAVMEIAEALKDHPCKRSVIFITYTAEEMGLYGSDFFIASNIIPKNEIKFNVNMDMIGRSSPENENTRAHYVVTDKKYLAGIENFIKGLNKGITDFPLIFDDDEHSPGGSDHMSFIKQDIPAFFFFSGLYPDLHQPGDDAEKIDYLKAESIARLAYRIATTLADMDKVPDFNQAEN
jgi:hypothetical protein